MNLWAVFLTGLTSGGLSCLAMQGGLLASIIANQKEDELKSNVKKNNSPKSFDQLDWLPVSLFLLAKLVVHVLLGFFLGWLGSKVELSLTVRLIFQSIAALFMLATAGNLLDLHPIFRYVVFQPPKFVQRMVKNSTKSKALFTPVILGLMTIFIPCGVTQAMEVLAITSGSSMIGALIMFFFVLGTLPLFAIVGVATAKLSEAFKQSFMKIAAAILIFLGLSSINGVLTVLNAPVTFSKMTQSITSKQSNSQIGTKNGAQQILIQVKSNGYSPNRLQVKAGIPVQLTLQTKNVYTCASFFILKAFNISMQLGPNDSQTVAFTPTKKGRYSFTCSMGMYTGILEVI
ncbi:sulfite exporter TauE/SafE family protein [Patescibacteria group bacterium]|nr:sulfite exporter TauE/SafE family protein [Patescibacteria group bacterium]